jgi:hypothetical protein
MTDVTFVLSGDRRDDIMKPVTTARRNRSEAALANPLGHPYEPDHHSNELDQLAAGEFKLTHDWLGRDCGVWGEESGTAGLRAPSLPDPLRSQDPEFLKS